MLPQGEEVFPKKPFPKPGDEVVISGIAGRFPESDNLTSFKENLYNKRDLVTDDDRRWKSDHLGAPKSSGKVNNIEKFDSRFFGVCSEDAQTMDPMGRMLLEHAYEAIVDAGVNPMELRGSNTGVFVSSTVSESELELLYDTNQMSGSGALGCSRGMLANRLSRWFGTTGPSHNVDAACSSSLYAMDFAYRAITTGECDAALVGGSHLCLHPRMTMQFKMLGVLSADGRCKSFDADGDGYCRSEAICVIYLQKAKDARRVYADVVYTKTNCDGFKEQGITFPSTTMQTALLQQFYEECGVPPTSLAYVEAHGTGTTAGDPVELNSLDKVLCPGRKTPLRIGSIKSNMGHAEPASGVCAIAKVIFAMESGCIPPNLHYNRPRENMRALVEGRIEVITEPTPWDGGYVGVNSFGFGGTNAHVLLRSNPKEKINNSEPNDDLPRLVVVSGRTREAVTTLLDDLESRPVDVEYVFLFHNIHAKEIPGHLYRGYTILPPKNVRENSIRDVQYYAHAKRPIWFVFSGIGSPWVGMGEALLKIPTFVKAIQKCNAALRPHGVDVVDILTTKDPRIFENVLNSFVGIAAVQIGLVDVLASIGIVPDGIIGHSIGELGCAYADGCLSAEQMVLAAYYQGLASVETETIPESMAIVGLSKFKLRGLCPPDIKIVGDNGSGSSTISGPLDSMKKFIPELKAGDVFVMEESHTKTAHLSRYILTAGPKLLAYMKKVIPNPKPRSQKWLDASVLCKKSRTSSERVFSPEYYANNLLTSSPVSFEEIYHLIPNGGTAIEITSNGLLQTILRKSFSEKVTSIAFANHENADHMKLFLQAIGKMYEVGLHPHLANLYPHVQYPVSRGTPMISPLIRWEHSNEWFVPKYTTQQSLDTGERVVEITLADEKFKWMSGYVIDGKNLVPPTAHLVLVWETFALMRGESYEVVPVVFEDVKFHRPTTIPQQESLRLLIMVQKGSGRFEVSEGNTAIVTGLIHAGSNSDPKRVDIEILPADDEPLDLANKDIYKELRLRGYHYAGLFRGLKGATLKGTRGSAAWGSNWVTFMDTILQLEILRWDTRGLLVPTGLQMLVINPKVHAAKSRAMDDAKAFEVVVHKDLGIIVAGGVEIRGLKLSAIAKKNVVEDPVLEDSKFVAHRDRAEIGLRIAIRLATHIALENHLGSNVKTIEFIRDADDGSIGNLTSLLIKETLDDSPLLQGNVNIIAPLDTFPADALPPTIQVSEPEKLSPESDALLVISHGLFACKDIETLKQLQESLKASGFLLAREPLDAEADIFPTIKSEGLDVISEKRTRKELVLLLRKRPKLSKVCAVIEINDREFAWLPKLQAALKAETNKKGGRENSRIILMSQGDFESGLMGLVKCLRKEPGGEVIQGLLIQDLQAPKFSLENRFYSEQLDLGLALNVLRPGKLWGSYRFLPLKSLSSRPVHHVQMRQLVYGDLRTLEWVEGRIRPGPRHKDVIELHYSSINFKDLLLSTGRIAADDPAGMRIAQENVIGFEFSGRDVNGHTVMGIIGSGAFSNLCVCDTELVWSVPNDWTLEDAATVPVAYCTAYYALSMKGGMKKGDKVLIHAGSGGVGQAAITLALHEGCEVFTTVGTQQKREFIKNQFPQIDEDHIGNSQDTSFEQLIFRKTHGRGVDIVLNPLGKDKLQASIRCLTEGGRFLEIGQFDLAADNSFGMEVFLKGISFHGVFVDKLFTTSSERRTQLVAMLAEGLKSGAVKPLVRTVFPMDQAEAAFRYMAAGKHVGKVVLKIRDEDAERQPSLPCGIPRYYCSEDGSYLILGGLGGFGLELADWLVLRGAKKLVLTSRRGITTGYQRLRINIWKSYGVEVIVIVGKDASTHEDCEYILKEAASLGPVEAIFNLAVVLKDALCENQTVESFEESFRAKAWATKQLDKLSRTLCPHLKRFVVFSSVTSGRGMAGQTNYGMSNSIMERICEKRAAENLPGLAVQWGAIGDVGLLAEMKEHDKEVIIEGTLPQRISSCLQELDGFLQQDSPVVSSMVLAEKNAGGERAATVVDAVANIMGIRNVKTVSLYVPLMELGMDSVMGGEIKQTLEREFNVYLTAEEIHNLKFSHLEKIRDDLKIK